MSIATNRTEDLLQSVDNFLSVHQQWSEDNTIEVLTEEYEQGIGDLFNEFSEGDMPGGMRELDRAVESLRMEWEAYEGYVSKASPMPNSAFWSAVAKLRSVRDGARDPDERPLESVELLHRQGVSPHQIAIIYSHNGIGPFMRNGIPQLHLVEQEIAKPGSVIGKDFVHPAKIEQARKSKEAKERWKQRTAATRRQAPTPGQESFEELLRQNLTVEQIAIIKCCSHDEVLAEANKLGIKPADPVNLTTLRAPHEPKVTKAQEQSLGTPNLPEVTEDDEPGDEGDEEEDDVGELLDPLELQALEMSDKGISATQIAKDLNLKTAECAAMLKAAKKKRDEASASG